VVLTHDVEGPAGVAHVHNLAEVESSLGFRSSFNFVPEGTYPDQPGLRGWLEAQGFEVGVHDLHHDGRLLDTRAGFQRAAARINHYLSHWGAVGFRAGFMLRQLDWFHDLKIQYDLSTFDTDPFEPQPDGMRTLFPFEVPAPAPEAGSRRGEGGGYVEMPYTLPQDSTLFLVLGEDSPQVWLQKTDWIAERGGMVLVNVHPDYIDFSPTRRRPRTYPLSRYTSLLQHLRSRHASSFWHALPRDVAAWFGARHPSSSAPLPAPLTPSVTG
jgi:hypothetical protein